MKKLFALGLLSAALNAYANTPASTVALPATATVQTETVKIEDTSKPKILDNLILAMDSENYKSVTSQNDSYDGDIESVQYLKLGYRIQPTLSAMVVGTWVQRLGYEEQNTATTPQDLQLRLTKSKLFNIGKMSFTSQNRAYLPTTSGSKGRGQIAQVRTYLIGSMPLTTKLELSLVSNPRYYIYESGDRKTGVNDFRFYNYGGLKYNFTDKFAAETTLGVFSARVEGGETAYYQDYSTSLYYTINKHMSLNGGIRATVLGKEGNIDKDGLELYNHNASEYFMIASLAL